MPRTADKTDIPNRLTEAGYLLFTKHGYNATGIQQITDQAGVPKGSFYNHFDSKEAFAAEIIGNYTKWVGQAWDTCMADAPAAPLAAIDHIFTRFIQHHEDTGCQGCLVGNFAAEVTESSAICREVLRASATDWRSRLGGLIKQAQDAGTVRADIPAEPLAAFLWNAWEGALLRMKIEHSPAPLKQTIRLLLDHLLRP